MTVALAIISVTATAVIIAVAAVVVAAALAPAIGFNDAGRESQQRTGKNNNQSRCHIVSIMSSAERARP